LVFDDETVPVPSQTVVATNVGVGTMSTVDVAAAPAAPWLMLSVSGPGNTQTITVTPSANGLADGTYSTTVTVSGGGADNSRTFGVTFSVGALIQAPTSLTATLNGTSVALAWTDNSGNETGFIIERRVSGGSYSQLEVVSADDVSYNDATVQSGTHYDYRIRATDGTENSDWSNTASVSVPLPPIIVTAPAAGETLMVGQVYHIRWSAPSVQFIQIDLSVNDGEDFNIPITQTGGISQDSPSWGNYPWTIPPEAVSDGTALIRVAQYQSTGINGMSGTFAVIPDSAAAVSPRTNPSEAAGLRMSIAGADVVFRHGLPAGSRAELHVFDLAGQRVALLRNESSSGTIVWQRGTAGRKAGGMYLVRVVATDACKGQQVVETSRLMLP